MVVAGEGVEQDGVDVVADAEGEEPHVLGRGICDVGEDAAGVDLAFGRQTVGQEEHHRRPLGLDHLQRFEQGQVDVGAAGRPPAARPSARRPRLCRRDQLAGVFAGAGAELDDVEAVLRVEVVQDVEERLLRLLDLLALHAAGGVEHDDDVLGDDLRLVVDARRGQEQEVARRRAVVQ